jgi:ABC-2 type transport system ATP-binding protein
VSSVDNDVLREALVEAGGVVDVERAALIVQGLSASDVGHIALVNGVALSELAQEQDSLEDLYYELTSGNETFKAAAVQ